MTDNPYDVLGVPTDASPEDIKKQYRKKARRAHPDVGGDTETMTALSVAYGILSDPKKRAQYDRTGKVNDTIQLNKEAVDQICRRFQQMMERFGPSIVYQDIIGLISRQFRDDIKMEKAKIQEAGKQSRFWFNMATRFKRKMESCPPILEQMAENSGRAQEAIKDESQENIKILEEAIRIVNGYEFEKDSRNDSGSAWNAGAQSSSRSLFSNWDPLGVARAT